jgi:integrase
VKKGAGRLQIELTLSQKKVKTFLDKKYRKNKSQKTVDKYAFCLAQFQTFLLDKYPSQKYTLESILPLLSKKKIPVYTLLDSFVAYLQDLKLSAKSISDYLTGVRSYLRSEDEYEVDISKFKDRVSLPTPDTTHEKAIDRNIISKILSSCNNRRLKAFLYVLATSGLRSMEAVSLRLNDVELSKVKGEPSIIHVRKEYSKSRRPRNVFITSEATEFLNQWLQYKYSEKTKYIQDKDGKRKLVKVKLQRKEDHIIFSNMEESDLGSVYIKLREGFNKILKTLNLDDRKEGMSRRQVTFHSFRRFVKTTITDRKSEAFALYILGHKRDMGYYTKTEKESLQDYKECMPFLTFTDSKEIEEHGKSIEDNLKVKDQQISKLNEEIKVVLGRYHHTLNTVSQLKEKVEALEEDNEINRDQIDWLGGFEKVNKMAMEAARKEIERFRKGLDNKEKKKSIRSK